MKDFSKKLAAGYKKLHVAIVASRYHEEITSKLVDGAKAVTTQADAFVKIFWVDGAFELPQAVQALAETGEFDAIVPLGCLVRGETAHFDYIARTVTRSLDEIGRSTGVAVSFGVLTVDSSEQANERAGGKWGNKGEEAALAAINLAILKTELYGKQKTGSRASASNLVSHRSR